MFKINIPIVKAVQKNDSNILVIEGIASDPTIDRDQERFTKEAVIKMADCINNGGVEIRVEHENKFYTNIGKWVAADILDEDKLYVKGEVDTELSLGNDVKVLLSKGKQLFLSVGGQVLDAAYEFSNELKRSIKVYKDVILKEISILTTPSNYNTSLAIVKSVDWNRLEGFHKGESTNFPYTQEAIQLINNTHMDMQEHLEYN